MYRYIYICICKYINVHMYIYVSGCPEAGQPAPTRQNPARGPGLKQLRHSNQAVKLEEQQKFTPGPARIGQRSEHCKPCPTWPVGFALFSIHLGTLGWPRRWA